MSRERDRMLHNGMLDCAEHRYSNVVNNMNNILSDRSPVNCVTKALESGMSL